MSQQSYIQFYREFMNNPIYKDENAFRILFHLILIANHEENHEFLWNGEMIKLKIGQLITGRDELSKSLEINPSTVYANLSRLQKWNEIIQKSNNRNTLITIVKYKKYLCTDYKSNNWITTGQQLDNTFNNNNKEEGEKITVKRMSKKDSQLWDMPAQNVRALYTFKFGDNREIERVIKNIFIKGESTEEELTVSVLNYGEEIKKNKTDPMYVKDPVNFFKGAYRNYIKKKPQNNIPNITNLLNNTNGKPI